MGWEDFNVILIKENYQQVHCRGFGETGLALAVQSNLELSLSEL